MISEYISVYGTFSPQGKLLLITLCLSPRRFWLSGLCLAVVVSFFVVEFRNRKYIAHWLALLAF